MTYNLKAEKVAYNVLKNIYTNKAYSTIELNRALTTVPDEYCNRITAIVYGVLEKSLLLDFYIQQLVSKKPKQKVAVLLKMGIYELLCGNVKSSVTINIYIELAKLVANGTHSFVSGVLRKVGEVELPEDERKLLALNNNCPEWAVDRLFADYGDRAKSILNANLPSGTHIRYNSRVITEKDFVYNLGKNEKIKSKYGYYVKRNTLKKLSKHTYTAQSLASMVATNKYIDGFSDGIRVLDLCSAPGGKSIYLEELIRADVTACDVHKHRVELIKSYSNRMKSNVKAVQNDATVLNENWIEKFDLVICDVPCSGSGLFKTSPDMLLFKENEDIENLNKLQYEIINIAKRYVVKNGVLAYSTCSMFNAENDNIADRFSKENEEFEQVDKTILLPDKDKTDGFYIARWVKN